MPGEIAISIVAPAFEQPAAHTHRLHDLCVAQAHLGKAVIAGGGRIGILLRLPHQPFVEQRHQSKDDGRGQREKAEQRMQHVEHKNIDRRPGKVEDGADTGAAHELTEGVEIAQGLAAGAVGALKCSGDHPPGEQPVKVDSGAGKHSPADNIQRGECGEGHQKGDREHCQRGQAA
jgi:hypothetical protein